MSVIGIDPGLEGAFAIFVEDGTYCVVDTPTITFEKHGKTRRAYEVTRIADALRALRAEVFLELVNAQPKNATRAAFLMGRGVGMWEGIIGTLGLPLHYVAPQSWKRHHRLLGTDKQAARLKAQQLFPAADLRRKKDVGRADALLIADYGRHLLRGAA